MDGESPAAGSCAGSQRSRHSSPHGADTCVWTHLLLRHLPFGHHDGRFRMAGQEGKEEPLHLLESTVIATSCCVHGVPHSAGTWRRHPRTVAGPLLDVRAHRHQPVAARLSGRQQRVGSHRRALRQLRLLPQRRLAALRHLSGHCRRDAGDTGPAGMAQRAHLLQHHLPRRYCAQHLCQVLVVEDPLRRGQVQELLAVHQELQGIVHRLQKPHRGLHALRDLWRLHREL